MNTVAPKKLPAPRRVESMAARRSHAEPVDSCALNTRDAIATLLGGLPVFRPGEVWLVGAGPGDPRHLTLEAVAALASADAVVHDALVDPRVMSLARPEAERVFAGKRGGKPSAVQADIAARLVELARAGRRVVRLKGGDPFMFGRGGEEVEALLAHGLSCRVVPGVTSGLAGLAAAGIPATMRGINQAVVLATGHGGIGQEAPDWGAIAATGLPLVLYMAMKNLPEIVAALIAGGRPAETPAAIIAAVATSAERVLVSRLDRIVPDALEAGMEPPAIVAIGDIVALRERLAAGLLPFRLAGDAAGTSDIGAAS